MTSSWELTMFTNESTLISALISEHDSQQTQTEAADSSNSTVEDFVCYGIDLSNAVHISFELYLFLSALLVLIGLAGNTLSMLVFSSTEMKTIPSNFFLLMLAVSDSLYLITVAMTKMLTNLRCLYLPWAHIDVFNRSTILCKTLQYAQDLLSNYSTCLIMAFTIERYIAVYMPLKFRKYCTVRRARQSCLTIFLIIAFLIMPYHFMYIGRPLGYNMCSVLPQHETEFAVMYILEMLLFRITPLGVIVVLNIMIIARVTKVTQDRRVRNLKKALGFTKLKREDKGMQLTIILVLVSTTYIVVYTPVLVHFVLSKLSRSQILQVSEEHDLILKNYSRTLYIAAFSINFFLYTLSGRVFREQLELILCSFARKKKEFKPNTTEMVSLM